MESVRLTVRTDRTEIVLQGGLAIGQTRETYERLNEALNHGQAITLDADRLDQVDGAGAQLLLAFCRAAHERGLDLAWRGVSPALNDVAQLLGLSDLLGISAGPAHVPSP